MQEKFISETPSEQESSSEFKEGDRVKVTLEPGMIVSGKTYEENRTYDEASVLHVEGDRIRVDIPKLYMLEVPPEVLEKISDEIQSPEKGSEAI